VLLALLLMVFLLSWGIIDAASEPFYYCEYWICSGSIADGNLTMICPMGNTTPEIDEMIENGEAWLGIFRMRGE